MSHHDDTEGHMPLKRGIGEPGPDEPNADDAEGHMPKMRFAEPRPDEPGGDMSPDEIRGRNSDPAPDEPGMEPDEIRMR
jgi:hypothetical protein